MKNLKKIVLISIFALMIFPLFLRQRTAVAEEWTYDGVDTERIPGFSVYPSEWYVYSISAYGIARDHRIVEIVKANTSNTFMYWTSYPPFFGTLTNGISIYTNWASWNTTTDEKNWYIENLPAVYWNGTTYLGMAVMITPINESTGKISEDIMEKLMDSLKFWNYISDVPEFEHNATYPNSYSIRFWNTTYNKAYVNANLTENGICSKIESYLLPNMENGTLYSWPAQETPNFDITTESGATTFNSTKFKLNITIDDADNNNDGEIDTDYLYRILNGTVWSEWADVPNLIDWDLGDVEAGNYDITVEVKNMYGVTQEEITIEYVPPKKKAPDFLPVIIVVTIVCIVGVAAAITLIFRRRIRGEKAVTKEIVDREIPPEKPEEPQVSEKIEDET